MTETRSFDSYGAAVAAGADTPAAARPTHPTRPPAFYLPATETADTDTADTDTADTDTDDAAGTADTDAPADVMRFETFGVVGFPPRE